MIKKSWMLLASMLLVGSLALTACGGGDDDDDSDDGDNTPAASRTADAGDETPADGDDGDGGSDNGGGDKDELRSLFEKFAGSSYSATYEVTGEEDLPAGTTVTIMKHEDGRFRFDFSGEQDGETFTGSIISTEEGTYLCSMEPGGEGACLSLGDDSLGNPLGSFTDEFEITDEDLEGTTILGKETREIAGREATCYTLTTEGDPEEATTCLDDDGVMLSSESAGSGFTATTVGDPPIDADFELPYPVQEIPSLGG